MQLVFKSILLSKPEIYSKNKNSWTKTHSKHDFWRFRCCKTRFIQDNRKLTKTQRKLPFRYIYKVNSTVKTSFCVKLRHYIYSLPASEITPDVNCRSGNTQEDN